MPALEGHLSLFPLDEEIHYKNDLNVKDWIENWDFTKANPKTYTHRIHNYPAIFIPQLVRKIILQYSDENDLVLDIFNGSGTTTLECNLTNRNSVGIELNPLADLIAKTKTKAIKPEILEEIFLEIKAKYFSQHFLYKVRSFKNIDYWYSDEAIRNISKLLQAIEEVNPKVNRNFFTIVTSKLLREVSFCKHSGFKMHKDKNKENLQVSLKFLWDKFYNSYLENYLANKKLFDFSTRKKLTEAHFILGSALDRHKQIKDNSVDLIVTSPPYGDSRTTVAYGQFSRLCSQWLDLSSNNHNINNISNLDTDLMGGKVNNINLNNDIVQLSETLKSSIELFKYKIEFERDIEQKQKLERRTKDVISFYLDLYKAIEINAIYLKTGKYFILVTASRVVKGVKLHTDMIISEFADNLGFELKSIMYRNIINKRMPRQVSATNIVGQKVNTMTRESIIILKKKH